MKCTRCTKRTIGAVCAIVFLFSLTMCVYSEQANSCINLTHGGIVPMLQSMWPSSQIINNGETKVITEPGSYHILENVEAEVLVNASDVVIDLNGFTFSGSVDQLITVSSNQENIVIKNGTISGNDDNIGIFIGQGAAKIFLEDLRFSDLETGVYFAGVQDNEITCNKITNCFSANCGKAYWLDYVARSIFQECEVCDCNEIGFYLRYCSYNKFIQCMAIRVGNIEPGLMAVGYFAQDGTDNLFYECFAEGIYKGPGGDGYTSDWCNKAIGFLFTGDETQSKVIDCLVDSITSTSWAHSFGISLDMMLRDTLVLSSQQFKDSITGFITSVATSAGDAGSGLLDFVWGPRCDYIAFVNETSGGDYTYGVGKFDGEGLLNVYTSPAGQKVNAVAWSNDGQYIAAVRDVPVGLGGEPEVEIFYVDTEFTLPLDFQISYTATDVVWFNQSKRFVTVGDPLMILFSLNDQTNTITELTNTNLTGYQPVKVAISPDDRYIFVADSVGLLYIYTADDLSLVAAGYDVPFLGDELFAMDVNPVACCGKYYIAVGSESDDGSNLGVLEFVPGLAILTTVTGIEFTENPVSSIAWSPNGKYLAAIAGSTVGLFGFNPQSDDGLYLLAQWSTNIALSGDFVPLLSWSPCGKYLGIGGARSTQIVVEPVYFNTQIFEVAYGPTQLLIDGNKVANCSSDMCSVGILAGSACNCITRNVCYENCINFSKGVYNVFYNGLSGIHGVQGNWSIPPY